MIEEQILTEALEDLDFFETIKMKLVGSRAQAASKLVTALEEISGTYNLIDSMLTQYLRLDFDQDSKQYEQEVLLSINSSNLGSQVAKARTRSGKITGIYNKYLTPWFAVLRQDEQERMQKLFWELWTRDDKIIGLLEQVTQWLIKEAEVTQDLVAKNKFDAANLRIQAARKKMSPIQDTIVESMRKLRNLKDTFIAQT